MNLENNHEDNQNGFDDNEPLNNNYLYNNEELIYSKKYTKITLSFILISLIKLFFYFYFLFFQNKENFSFESHFILTYGQYYRCITRFFINYGIMHLILELYLLFYGCFYFENMLGTIFTTILILISFLFISLINLCLIELFKYLYFISNRSESFDTDYEGGLTPLFFFLYTFYFSFDANSNKIFFLLIIIVVKAKNSEYLLLLILIFFTPNESLIGNLSGIIAANLLMKCKKIFLPRILWIINVEKKLEFLNKMFPFYRSLSYDNPIMKKIIIEYDKGCNGNESDVGQQMTELTLLSSENEVNNNNNNN